MKKRSMMFWFILVLTLLSVLALPGLAQGSGFYFLRLTRVLAAFLTGGGLSLCAWFFQSLTRNPLTSEYTLGVSSAAAFFAGLGLILGWSPSILSLAGGTGFSFFLLLALNRRMKGNSLILLGIVFNIFFSSGIMLLNYLTSFRVSQSLSRWIFGGFSLYSWQEILWLAVLALALLTALARFSSSLVLISVSEIYEEILGKNFKKPLLLLILLSGLFISLSSTLAGPVPFFALLLANAARKLTSGDPLKSLGICFLGGGGILALLDTFSRLISPVEEIPMGVTAAVLGLPFLFLLMMKEKT